MSHRNQYNGSVPDTAIACLHHAAIAGMAVAYRSGDHSERIALAKEALAEAKEALADLEGSCDQYYMPALSAAIANAETEIAWAEREREVPQ